MGAQGAWSNQLQDLIILSAAQSGFSGFFVYSPAPGKGNLIGSWAAAAGTDPYGNHYPEGLDVNVGSITGGTISGVTIEGSTFSGTDFVINSNGFFFYNGTPAAGNPPLVWISQSSADPFGNAVAPNGVGVYNNDSGDPLYAFLTEGSLLVATTLAAITGGYASQIAAAAAGQLSIASGGQNGSDAQAEIILGSADSSGGKTRVSLEGQTATLIDSGASLPITDASMNPQGSAGATYSQAFTQATVTRVNALIADLISAGIVTP